MTGNLVRAVVGTLLLAATASAQIAPILDATGDGKGNPCNGPVGVAVDRSGNVYVAAWVSSNVFRITPDGTITELVDGAILDAAGNRLLSPFSVAVDEDGAVYAAGYLSSNAYMITDPGGANTLTKIIDRLGDGQGNALDGARSIAVDRDGNVFVAGQRSDNVFMIADPGGANVITEIIDGEAHRLDIPNHVAVDGWGNAYVSASGSRNVFRIADPGGANTITEILDGAGGGPIAVDGDGAVYAVSPSTGSLLKIAEAQPPEVIMDAFTPNQGIAVDRQGNVYVSSSGDAKAFKVTDPCGAQDVSLLMDGSVHVLFGDSDIAVDREGNVYVTGGGSHNVFRIEQPPWWRFLVPGM